MELSKPHLGNILFHTLHFIHIVNTLYHSCMTPTKSKLNMDNYLSLTDYNSSTACPTGCLYVCHIDEHHSHSCKTGDWSTSFPSSERQLKEARFPNGPHVVLEISVGPPHTPDSTGIQMNLRSAPMGSIPTGWARASVSDSTSVWGAGQAGTVPARRGYASRPGQLGCMCRTKHPRSDRFYII